MNILNTQTLSNEALQSKLDQAMAKPELTAAGDLRHFIGVEGLSKAQLMAIIEKANGYLTDNAGRPNSIRNSDELEGCTVMNLFFENSTRTRTTFDVAAKRLGASVISIDIAKSSTQKGESLRDTLWNLEAMTADIFVVRHSSSGAAHFMATEVTPNIANCKTPKLFTVIQ